MIVAAPPAAAWLWDGTPAGGSGPHREGDPGSSKRAPRSAPSAGAATWQPARSQRRGAAAGALQQRGQAGHDGGKAGAHARLLRPALAAAGGRRQGQRGSELVGLWRRTHSMRGIHWYQQHRQMRIGATSQSPPLPPPPPPSPHQGTVVVQARQVVAPGQLVWRGQGGALARLHPPHNLKHVGAGDGPGQLPGQQLPQHL